MRKKYIIIAMFFLCVSCTVGPDYETPQLYSDAVLQNELELQKNGKLPHNWYKSLNDDYLQDLIEKGLRNNTDVTTAEARLKQARLTAKINNADYLPQIGGKGGYDYEKGSKNVGYLQNTNYFSVGFDASWELDVWGKGRRQSEADEANMKARAYDLSNVKTMIAAEIAVNYINLQKNRENLRMARRNADLQRQIADTVKKEYQSGLSDETAYNQAIYLLQTTLAQIPQYENNVESYKNALSGLLGVLPSEIKVPKKTKLLSKYYGMDSDMHKLPVSVIRLRPDVAAAEQELKAQNALIGKAVAELYPDINISGLFGYASRSGKNLFSSSSENYGYSPAFSITLLDWNKLYNNVEIQKQEKEIAFANYKQSVLNAISELKNSFSSYQSAVSSYENKLHALESMQKVNDSMLKRYHHGLIKFSEVLDSQQNLITAQKDVINAGADIATSMIAYYKASGAVIDN